MRSDAGAQRITANIAKLPELVRKDGGLVFGAAKPAAAPYQKGPCHGLQGGYRRAGINGTAGTPGVPSHRTALTYEDSP